MGFFQVGILTGYLLFAYLCGACVKRWGLAMVINGSVITGGIAYLSAILFAFAFNGFVALMTALFGDHLPLAQLPRIFGLSTLIHGLGQAAGVGLAGWLKDLTSTFAVPFLLAFLAIGVCPLLLRFLTDPTAVRTTPASKGDVPRSMH